MHTKADMEAERYSWAIGTTPVKSNVTSVNLLITVVTNGTVAAIFASVDIAARNTPKL